jgi:hypothetical protein
MTCPKFSTMDFCSHVTHRASMSATHGNATSLTLTRSKNPSTMTTGLSSFTPELIYAAIQARRVGKFADAIRSCIDRQHPPRANGYSGQTGPILTALASEPEIDLEDETIRYLANKVAVDESLHYLQMRGHTARARDAVAAFLPGDDGRWGRERAAALAAIDERLNHRP